MLRDKRMIYFLFIKRIRTGLLRRLVCFVENRAKKKLQKNLGLWNELCLYLEKTQSTGCSFIDYFVLYSYIKKNKPTEVLECSTGVSTIVMAHAMMENEKEGFSGGRITSLEESFEYCNLARELLPDHLLKYVEILHRNKVEAYHYFYRGVKYDNKPVRDYDFVFVDGPTTSAPSDGQKTFDFDLIEVVSKSKIPVSAIVDCRKSTCYVFGKVFGKNKVRYDNIRSLGFVDSCIKSDLRKTNDIVSSYKDLK